jgi:hypothetical protein
MWSAGPGAFFDSEEFGRAGTAALRNSVALTRNARLEGVSGANEPNQGTDRERERANDLQSQTRFACLHKTRDPPEHHS